MSTAAVSATRSCWPTCAGSPTRSRRRTPTTSTARRASRSRRSTRCARWAPCPPSCRPRSAAAASPSRRSPRPASSSAATAAPARWSSRCTRSRSPASSATSTARPGSRTTCARSSPSSAWSPRSPPRSAPAATWASRSPRSPTADDGVVSFEKQAPTVSYGAYADDLLTTVRRAPDAEPGDQVLALTRSEQMKLEPTGTWDPLGMRGTCSPGFVVRAEFAAEQVLATPFSHDLERVDDADLAHPLVARLARHRHRRLRPRPRLRPGRGQAQARRAAARGDPPLGADERAVAAAGRGHRWRCASSARPPTSRPRPALGDGDDPALQQPQDRRLRAGAAGLPGRARRLRDRRLQERHARSASAATCATRCRPA